MATVRETKVYALKILAFGVLVAVVAASFAYVAAVEAVQLL
jgi:hypothetical protein